MTYNIFDYLEYTDFIQNIAKSLGISYKALAISTRIHSSYFSRVMQGKADFSKEQLFLIAKDLKLSGEETEFLLLLGEHNSSSNELHKNFVLQKITKIRNEKLRLTNNLQNKKGELTAEDVSVYYEEAITAKIHMSLTVNKYRLAPNLLCKKLFISENKLAQELKKLQRLNILDIEGEQIKVLKFSIHLDESHPASIQNHINWRFDSMNQLIRRNSNPSDYHLSAVFSCNEEGKMKIRDNFKKFVIQVQGIVENSTNSDQVYFLGLDLY